MDCIRLWILSQGETVITVILPFVKLSSFWKWQMVQIVCSNKVWPVWNCYSKYMPGNSTKVFSSDQSIQKLEASSIGRRRKIPICISWNPKNWGAWNVHYGKFNCGVSMCNIFWLMWKHVYKSEFRWLKMWMDYCEDPAKSYEHLNFPGPFVLAKWHAP